MNAGPETAVGDELGDPRATAGELGVTAVAVDAILAWRERYRAEMDCQIVHDSLHARAGWTQAYRLEIAGRGVGYGSVLVGGPWSDTRTVFEFHVLPEWRARVFDLFEVFLGASGATRIQAQTNDALLTVMLHTFGRDWVSDKVVFHDRLSTAWPARGAIFRPAVADDAGRIFPHRFEPVGDFVLEWEGAIAATGGILFHYNRPYGDVFMEVAEPYRRRGFGAYLVQELKRVCRERGGVPCARCDPANLASRRTCQKAGFVPCAQIVNGAVAVRAGSGGGGSP